MTKKQVTADMKADLGTFVTVSQIARYMHWSRDKVRLMVAGLEHIEDGKSRWYYTGDVVDRLMQMKGVN